MATYTSKLNLKKPASNDYVNIADINGNMDILDKAVLIDNAQTISGVKTFTSGARFNDKLIVGSETENGSVEIYHNTPFIDLHYGKSASDYTARIINNNDGVLSFIVANQQNHSMSMSMYAQGFATVSYRAYSSAGNSDILVKSHVADMPVVHLTGNEQIDGIKTYVKMQKMLSVGYGQRLYAVASTRWYEVYRLKKTNTDRYLIDITGGVNNASSLCHGRIYLMVYGDGTTHGGWIYRYASIDGALIVGDVCAIVDNNDNTVSLYFKLPLYGGLDFNLISGKEQADILPPSAVKMRSDFTPSDVETLPSGASILQNMTQR